MSLVSQLNALITRIAQEVKSKVSSTDPRLSDTRLPSDASVTYQKVAGSLKNRGTVIGNIDLSTLGIGAITLSFNVAFAFTGFQLNKSYILIINANGYVPSWSDGTKHIAVEGNANFSNTGVYYVCLTCIDATAGSEKLLTMIMKGA